MRPNLVIVRAGDDSRHPGWLECGSERSWDMIVSYYGDDADRFRQSDILRFDAKGPKYPALTRLIREQADLIAGYGYVWLPDDDIECTAGDIDRFFQICRDRGLWLAQPALSPDSQFSWSATLHNPMCRLRFTNFVEIMMPCFERAFLERCQPTFARSESGWGLDHVWPRLARDASRRIAIVDEVTAAHRRPLGGPWYAFLGGRSASDELEELVRAEKIADRRIRTNAIVSRGGRTLAGQSLGAMLLLAVGYGLALARAFALGYPNRRCFVVAAKQTLWVHRLVQSGVRGRAKTRKRS